MIYPDPSTPASYSYTFDIDDNSTASSICKFVERKTRVLDVGAGKGVIAFFLQDSYKCQVDAIEFNSDSIEHLRNNLENVYEIDLNNADDLSNIPIADELYDYIILADVLEHLYNPWETISNLKKKLKPDGFFVISLPHVGHVSVVSAIISGSFPYRETGLLDKTHIRFFGPRDMQNLVAGSGLSIDAIKPIWGHPEHVELAEFWMNQSLETKKVLASNPWGYVYQVILKCSLKDSESSIFDIATFSPEMPWKTSPHFSSKKNRFFKRIIKKMWSILRA